MFYFVRKNAHKKFMCVRRMQNAAAFVKLELASVSAARDVRYCGHQLILLHVFCKAD